MSANDILKQAINLKPQERYLLIENLIASLNEPDKNIETLWIEESKKKFNDYNEGNLETVSYDEVFK